MPGYFLVGTGNFLESLLAAKKKVQHIKWHFILNFVFFFVQTKQNEIQPVASLS